MVHPLIIIGSQGFIGRHFSRAFPDALAIERSQLDLSAPQISFSTEGRRFALITAGITNPRRCEQDPQSCYLCNVEGTLKLGRELSARGIIPVFFSSDYVFDDNLELNPLNTYGRQKRELETRACPLDALVIRLSKVYGLEKGDGTLFDEMASKLCAHETVLAATDQIFAPIYVKDLISQTLDLLQTGRRGIVNIMGPSYASRFEMAKRLAIGLGGSVKEISLDDLNDGVMRPKFLKVASSLAGLSWQEGVDKIIKLYENNSCNFNHS